jgi:alpha-L-fucosidase
LAIVSRRAKKDPNLLWFDEARFGMFIHFGLYALLGRGEWVMYHEQIPRRKYENLMSRFNPTRFDADAWVDLASRAGARYITVTAKHHDGFCLFDSRHTDFKIANTPFGRDLIGELIRACRRRGMRIILYYSQPDWHHPNYLHKLGAFKDLQRPPPTDRPDWPKFQQYLENQVLELVTRYGRIDGIWFDGSHKSEREWRGRHLYHLIKRRQPWAVVNDRARYGDFFTPERSLPDDLTGFLFEACESVATESWGYRKDTPLFSVPHLIESLVRMAAAGGNYLLNVGPKPDGTIPEDQALRMEAIGAWLKRNGEAIYSTRECKVNTGSPHVLATRSDCAVYLHLLRWPLQSRLLIPGVRSRPALAQLMGGERLKARLTRVGLELSDLPAAPPEHSVNVIELRFGSPPRLRFAKGTRVPLRTIALHPDAPGRLAAADAQLRGYGVKGSRLRLHAPEGSASPCITGWNDLGQSAAWTVSSPAKRRYRVSVRLSCPAPYAGAQFVIEAARQRLRGEVKATPSFDDFLLHRVGTLSLPRGECRLAMRATHMPYGYIFANAHSIELRAEPPPVRPPRRRRK